MLQGEHSAILFTFIKLPLVIKFFVLSIFEWPLKTGFTVWDMWLGLASIYGILADLASIHGMCGLVLLPFVECRLISHQYMGCAD